MSPNEIRKNVSMTLKVGLEIVKEAWKHAEVDKGYAMYAPKTLTAEGF